MVKKDWLVQKSYMNASAIFAGAALLMRLQPTNSLQLRVNQQRPSIAIRNNRSILDRDAIRWKTCIRRTELISSLTKERFNLPSFCHTAVCESLVKTHNGSTLVVIGMSLPNRSGSHVSFHRRFRNAAPKLPMYDANAAASITSPNRYNKIGLWRWKLQRFDCDTQTCHSDFASLESFHC